jgi:hypothetical protein
MLVEFWETGRRRRKHKPVSDKPMVLQDSMILIEIMTSRPIM